MTEGFKIASAFVQIDPDMEGFKEKLQAALDEAVAGARASVPIDADITRLEQRIEEAKAKLDELKSEQADAKIGADDSGLDEKADDAKAKLDELDSKKAEPKIGADDSGLDEKAEDAKEKLDELDSKRAEAKIGADDSDAQAKIKALETELALLRLRRQGIFIDADATPAEMKIAQLQAELLALKAESSGIDIGSTPGLGLIGEHPMIAGLTAGITGLLPGIGGAATGMGLLAGTGALALSGVFRAVSAAHQAAMAIGMTQQQLAATEFANSVQIQQAQVAIGQAHLQAAADAANAAMQITQSQMGLAETVRNAAAAQIQAQQQVGQAEHSLADAQFGEQQAQMSLTAARIQARITLQQLLDAEKDAALGVRSASLALQQARYQQMLTDQNAYSTILDRKQAALAVAEAEQKLKEAHQQQANATTEASKKNRKYFDGQMQVIQAEHALKDAIWGVHEAQLQVADAQRALRDTMLNNATAIKEAQMAVAAAERNAAYTQIRDSIAVQQAQRNLTNTIKEQQLQMAAMKASANTALLQYGKDMARLSPAGRQMVREILSMRGAFRQMEFAAQGAVAPGMLVFLRGIHALMPTITSGVRDMGHAISAAFAQFGKQMQTPWFAHVLSGLIHQGIIFANTVLPSFAHFVQELAKAGAKSGAVSGLAGLLAGIGNGLTDVVKGVEPFTGSLGKLFSLLGGALASLGKPLGEIVGALGTALVPALAGVLPPTEKIISLLGSDLAQVLVALAPDMSQIGQAAGATAELLLPLLPIVTKLAVVIAQVTLPTLVPMAQMLVKMGQGAVVAGHLVSNLISGVGKGITWLWHSVTEPFWQNTVAGAQRMWQGISQFFTQTATQITSLGTVVLNLWHNYLDPAWQGIVAGVRVFVRDLGSVWHGLETVFKTPVDFLITTVYDKGIARLWNDVVTHIGLSSIKLPVIAGMASGGVLPGYAPGRDSVPVMASPGEGFLNPSAVQAIGPGTVHALNAAYPPGSTSSSGQGSGGGSHQAAQVLGRELRRRGQRAGEHLLGFAGGGLLGDLSNLVTSLGRDILTGAHFAAELAADPSKAITTLLDKVIGTTASGELGKVMTALPRSLVASLARGFVNLWTGGGGSGHGVSTPVAVTGTAASWFNQAVKLTGVGKAWIPDLETIAHYESNDNPDAINLWDSNAAAGDPSRGIMQTIMSTFLAYHQPGTSMNIYDPVANIAAAIRYIKARYGTVANVPGIVSLSHGGPYVGYDQGGWMMPVSRQAGMPVNLTGRPEAVLSPEESAAFVAIARRLAVEGVGGGGIGGAHITQNYFGSIYPTSEQLAEQRRDLALAVGGPL